MISYYSHRGEGIFHPLLWVTLNLKYCSNQMKGNITNNLNEPKIDC